MISLLVLGVVLPERTRRIAVRVAQFVGARLATSFAQRDKAGACAHPCFSLAAPPPGSRHIHIPADQPLLSGTSASFPCCHHRPCHRSFRPSCLLKKRVREHVTIFFLRAQASCDRLAARACMLKARRRTLSAGHFVNLNIGLVVLCGWCFVGRVDDLVELVWVSKS